MMNIFHLVADIKSKLPGFLEKMEGTVPGSYRYSLSGDLFPANYHFGLGNTVFAVRTKFILNMIGREDLIDAATYIKSFQTIDGYIFDPTVMRKSAFRRWYYAGRTLDFNNFFNEQTKRAETRQSLETLGYLGIRSDIIFQNIPSTSEQVKKYIHSLNWKSPWGASSHISHLLFFLKYNQILFHHSLNNIGDLIKEVIEEINKYQQQEDGSWYDPSVRLPPSEKVNSAMKMMIAHRAAGDYEFRYPERLIDLCLNTINDGHACNHFNIICVLYYSSKLTDHRKNEMIDYAIKRIQLYQEHYWEDHGAFSFQKGKANSTYYNAKISRGFAEPDIHGTVMFLNGIALIADLLEIREKLGIKDIEAMRCPEAYLMLNSV